MTNQGQQGGSSERGFAGMDEQKQREIASKGGKAAHEKGTAHEFSHEEAVEAGRKGGEARGSNEQSGNQGGGGRSGNQNSERMSEIGRKGGQH